MISNFLPLFYWTCITRFFIWRLHFMSCCKSLACMGIDGLIVMWDKRTNGNKEVNLQIKTLFECVSMICVGVIESITTSLQKWPNNFWPTHILNNFQLTVNSNLLWFFTKLCSVIGPENSHHPLHQSDAKLKRITLTFSHTSSTLPVFTLSSH